MSINPPSSSPYAAPVTSARTAAVPPAPTAPPAASVEISPAARKALGGVQPQPTNVIWGSAPSH